jgi:hypothetical protein
MQTSKFLLACPTFCADCSINLAAMSLLLITSLSRVWGKWEV